MSGPARWSYGWGILAVSFLTLSVTFSLRFSFGLFFSPIEAEFGWDRTTLSAAVSINMIVYGLCQPLVGRLADRYGPKWVVVASVVSLVAGLALLSQAHSALELHLFYGVLVGIGLGGTGFVTQSALLSRWFMKRRTLALGLGLSGGSAGAVVMVPATVYLLLSLGWRPTALILAAASLLLIIPLNVLLVRDRPGLEPATVAGPVGAPRAAGLRTGEAARTRPFWMLVGGFSICGFTITLISMHLPGHVARVGLSPEVAATALSLLGLMGAAGSVLVGVLASRVEPRFLLAGAYLLRGLGVLVLLQASEPLHFVAFALIAGLGWTSTVPLTSGLAASNFGRASMATIFGLVSLGHQIGDATGVLLAGVFYDLTGNYQIPFTGVVVLLVVAATFSFFADDRAAARLRAHPA